MSIEILSSRRRYRRFLVYDMEWIPGSLQVRMVGVYDGNRYRYYLSVEKFLANELTSENRGKWFYAHAGGLADVQFVFEALANHPDYRATKVRASFSGSSAIIVRVTKGKNSWIFVDSYWLLRDKLANIAKSIGMEKTGPDESDEEAIKEWYASVSMEVLIPYNEMDCRILFKAIEEFELALISFGGELKMTLASSAMSLFRRRYLKREIETFDSVNEKARHSYVASRVEVFREEMPLPANYYDVNSLFPFAMTYPCPGELVTVSKGDLPLPGTLYIADVEIEVPDFYLTPTPLRLGGRVFFPVGRWRSWYTSVDIELLLKEGGRVHKIHQVLHFEPFHDLAQYARDIYARRRATTDPFYKQVLKLLLNSLYGKFAESDEKSMIHLHPGEGTLARLSREHMLFPGCYEERLRVPVPHMWVPISTFITSRGRAILYSFLTMTRRFYYCDTDGFPTGDTFSTGTDLGELKLEKVIEKVGRFIAPKLYRIDDKVKAKGFSLGWDENKQHKKQRAIELFETLVAGGEITVTRMSRLKENLQHGRTKPKEDQIVKRLAKHPIKKRCHDPKTGVSRPWSVDELKAKGLK